MSDRFDALRRTANDTGAPLAHLWNPGTAPEQQPGHASDLGVHPSSRSLDLSLWDAPSILILFDIESPLDA